MRRRRKKINLQERNEQIFNFHFFYQTELEIIDFAVHNFQFTGLLDTKIELDWIR